VTFDAQKAGISRDEVVQQLAAGGPSGAPAIMVAQGREDSLFLNPMTLADGEEQLVLDRLVAILSARQ
jgi:hypothetical protein